MEYHKFGRASSDRLDDLYKDDKDIVVLALALCEIDFSVIETIRTRTQQQINIDEGVSWTMNSQHLADGQGKARAVDIYPWVDGASSMRAPHFNQVAKAMFEAGYRLGQRGVRWGGFWGGGHQDMPHWEFYNLI